MSSLSPKMSSIQPKENIPAPKTHRELGLFTATCLIIGNIIGTGIFLLPAALAPYGAYALIGWLISTAGAVCLALIFAYLSHRVPLAGGLYAYSRKTFGEYIGFQVAWNYWIAACIGNAAFLVGVPAYLSVLFPQIGQDKGLALIVSLCLYWTFVGVHCLGIKEAAFVQNITTVLKLIPLLLIPAVGLFFIQTDYFAFQLPSSVNGSVLKALAETSILTIWAFIRIESATIPAQAPAQDLAQSQAPYALAAEKLFPHVSLHWIQSFIALVAVISGVGTLNGWILMQAQMPYAASRDGLFPKVFQKGMHKGTPILGLLVGGVFVTTLLLLSQSGTLVDQYVYIIKISAFSVLVCYLYPVVASLLLIKHPKRKAFYGLLALVLIAISYLIWAMVGAGYETIALGSLLFFASTPIYFWIKRTSSD